MKLLLIVVAVAAASKYSDDPMAGCTRVHHLFGYTYENAEGVPMYLTHGFYANLIDRIKQQSRFGQTRIHIIQQLLDRKAMTIEVYNIVMELCNSTSTYQHQQEDDEILERCLFRHPTYGYSYPNTIPTYFTSGYYSDLIDSFVVKSKYRQTRDDFLKQMALFKPPTTELEEMLIEACKKEE